jgi:hypothetical protein
MQNQMSIVTGCRTMIDHTTQSHHSFIGFYEFRSAWHGVVTFGAMETSRNRGKITSITFAWTSLGSPFEERNAAMWHDWIIMESMS